MSKADNSAQTAPPTESEREVLMHLNVIKSLREDVIFFENVRKVTTDEPSRESLGRSIEVLRGSQDKLYGSLYVIIKIAIQYGRYDIARTFERDVGFFPSKREKLIQSAFNKLVDEHNARIQDPNYSNYHGNNNTSDSADFGGGSNGYDGDYTRNAEKLNADTESPFEILGVSETASESEVKAAYRHKCTLFHPDKFTSEQREDEKFNKMINDEMSKINNAYEAIKERKGRK